MFDIIYLFDLYIDYRETIQRNEYMGHQLNKEIKKINKRLEKDRIAAERAFNVKKYVKYVSSETDIEYNYYKDEMQLYKNECAFLLALIESDRINGDDLLAFI